MTKTHTKSPNKAVQKIADILEENKKLQDKLNRSLADYQNLEKRLETQKQVFVTLTMASIFDKVLASLDDLHLVSHHLKDRGLEMALEKLDQVLLSEGLEEIEALNQIFDPTTMDCVDTDPSVEKDKVSKVSKNGYRYNGQVIRPAQVIVGTKVKN